MAASKSLRRLVSLEREAARRAAPTACPECGGPIPGRSSYVVAGPDGRPYWGVCRTCGLALDKTGKALPAVKWEPGMGTGIKVYDYRTPIDAV